MTGKLKLIAATSNDLNVKAAIWLRIGDVAVRELNDRKGDEAYTLIVEPDRGIEIIGKDAAGVFYGIQTLRELFPIEAYATPADSVAVAGVHVEDAPRFRYRGLHLDVWAQLSLKKIGRKAHRVDGLLQIESTAFASYRRRRLAQLRLNNCPS